jgi:hypothetical protein
VTSETYDRVTESHALLGYIYTSRTEYIYRQSRPFRQPQPGRQRRALVDTVGTHPRAAASDSSFLCRRRQGQRPPASAICVARPQHDTAAAQNDDASRYVNVNARKHARSRVRSAARARSAKSWAVNRQCPLRTTRTEQAQCVGVPGQRTRRRPSTSAWRPLWPRSGVRVRVARMGSPRGVSHEAQRIAACLGFDLGVMDGCALFFSFCMASFTFARWISHHSPPVVFKCGAKRYRLLALCSAALLHSLHACRLSLVVGCG